MEDDHVIQTFPAYRPDQPFCVRRSASVRAPRTQHFLDPKPKGRFTEYLAVNAVAIELGGDGHEKG